LSALAGTLEKLFKSKESGIIFIISDFINTTDEEIEMIGLLRKRFNIFAFMVRDRVEKFLPKGINAVSVEDPDTGKTIIVNLSQVREDYEQEMIADEQRLTSTFLKHDVGFKKFYTHMPFETSLREFFKGEQTKKWS
jgi:hypothetical protein